MKKTEHYQLSQWEYPDRILMSDFNADNAKIDAALASEAAERKAAVQQTDTRAHPILLKRWIAAEESTRMDCDLTDIQWKKYALAILEFYFTSSIIPIITMNGGGHCGNGNLNSAYFSTDGSTAQHKIFCPVLYRDDIPLMGVSFGNTLYACSTRCPAREVQTLSLVSHSTGKVMPGTQVDIWGIL